MRIVVCAYYYMYVLSSLVLKFNSLGTGFKDPCGLILTKDPL